MSTVAIIVAAGKGNRAGGKVPKQWRTIGGKLVVDWSIDAFKNHDLVGAELLRENGFSALVVSAVENHVAAKRYLCTKFQNYFDQLSLASLETLKLQGGMMNETEILEFESHPYFDENIKIRKIDELAKEEHMEIVAVESFKEILLNHLIN